MERKINYFLILIFIIIGCASKKQLSENNIIGKWEASNEFSNLTIVFTKQNFAYFEKQNNIKFNCRYKVENDTLFLLKGDSIEKHFIYKLDKKELKFNAENPNSVDVPLIDGMNFKRVSN